MPSKKLIEAIKDKISRPATSTMDAIFKKCLEKDLKNKDFKSDNVKAIARSL